MILRPNVRARCYQLNLQARCPDNRKYYKRGFKLYVKACAWCRRPITWSAFGWPGLCEPCGGWLNVEIWDAEHIEKHWDLECPDEIPF